jgi:phosphoribosylglycinamide formyltransferase-1
MPEPSYRVAVFASGSGTNAEEIFKYFLDHPQVKVVLLLSNNPQAYALERAKRFNIPARVFNRQEWKEQLVLEWLKEYKVTHIVLAGFLWLVPEYLINAYQNKIVNIHPALLPKFGGKGLYGMKVHEAVRAANEKETGITIHLVNEKYDDGKILFQGRCPITLDDTPGQIAEKVHQLEHEHYPNVIEQWLSGSV